MCPWHGESDAWFRLSGQANASARQRYRVYRKPGAESVTARARLQHVNRRIFGEFHRGVLSCKHP